jgi:molybdopterin molybdotransferase
VLSIEDARERVLAVVRPLGAEQVDVADALGRVLATDVVAAADVPRFDNSAMDGFAAHAGPAGRTLALIGESRAGAPFAGEIGDGEAIRISTGAAVPAGDDIGVLQLELVEEHDTNIECKDDLRPGRNIRRTGEDLRAGEVIVGASALIGPAEISVAINAGAGSLDCAIRPRVAIVNTGDELVAPGNLLGPGQIHDSNGPTLAALATRAGADVISVDVARDDPGETRSAIERALEADVVVLSGGVSVGPHDHVKEQLEKLGVKEDFWRVALRPGKPTWFGTKGSQLAFGLPGNPVSVYVTFVLFVAPALRALQGADPDTDRGIAKLGEAIKRSPKRDECVRVSIADGIATTTGPQGSHVTSSLLGADALAIIARGEGDVAAGELVPTIVL